MMTSIVIERWIAFIFIRKYESGYTKLGPALIALAIFISSLLTFVLFNGQNFDGWYVNGRTLPLSAYSRANTVLFSMLGSNIICLVLTITLHLLTPKRRIRMSLSSKFQRRENLIASKLFFYIATLQFTVYCCSQSASLYVRIYHSKDPMALAYKENVDFFNLYTLAMPVLSTLYFAKVKRQRMKDIKNHLDIKTIGSDGWTNYLTMIQKQWK
uniref:Serpentine receptor class gamma n=1 Tax=Haemonchus contortus TaxID=6289 RepID=A0A7I4YMY1_HAECO